MTKSMNIGRFIKALMLVLAAVFLLSACDVEKDRTAFPTSNLQGKEVNPQILQEQRSCWQSGILDTLYDGMGKVAFNMYSQLTSGALTFMMVAFALWTAFRLLKFVGSFTEESPSELWNEILRKLFICFFCGWLASSTSGMLTVMNSVIFPVYNAFLEFGSEILTSATKTSAAKGKIITFWGENIEFSQSVVCKAENLENAKIDKNLERFPDAPRQMMGCLICAVNERLSLGMALSFKVLAEPGIMSTITGLLLLICFVFVKLGFVFYLIDSVFRMTIMLVLLPLLVMSFAFKKTAGWMKTGFLTIINSAALMMFMAVMIGMTLLALEQIMIDSEDIFGENATKESFREFSIPFMCLLMIAFLISSSVKIAKQVTDSLVGGGGDTNFAKQGAKLGAVIAKYLTLQGGKAVLKGGKALLKRGKK